MKHFILGITSILSAIIVVLFFQNCSEPLADGTDVSSVAAAAPFAYDTKIDQLAYMSCSKMGASYDTNAYFTFKVGAYNDGAGLRLTPDFVYATRNLLVDMKAQALEQSPLNRNAHLQLGIRRVENLQELYIGDKIPHGDFFGSLSTSSAASELANNNGVSYSRNFTALGASPFADHINLTNYETNANPSLDTADTFRTKLQLVGDYVLALAYGKVGSIGPAITTDAYSPQGIFGLGYKMTFARGKGLASNFTVGPTRVLSSLSEFDLTNGDLTSSIWDCPTNWQFMIVRPGDVDRAPCENTNIEPTPVNSTQTEMYNVIRRMLPASDWGLNLNRRCIVPKKSGLCYGTDSAAIVVKYDGGLCDYANGTCPHYVSICKKR